MASSRTSSLVRLLQSEAWFVVAGVVLSAISMLFNVLFYTSAVFNESAGMRVVGVVAMVAMEVAKLGMIVFVLPTTSGAFPRVAAGVLLAVSGVAALGTAYASMMPDVARMQAVEEARLRPLHAEALAQLDGEFRGAMAQEQAGMATEMATLPGPRYRAHAHRLDSLRSVWQNRRGALVAAQQAERDHLARSETFVDDVRARVRKVEGFRRSVNVLLRPLGVDVSYPFMSVLVALLVAVGIETMVYLVMGHIGRTLAAWRAVRRETDAVKAETEHRMKAQQDEHAERMRTMRSTMDAWHEAMSRPFGGYEDDHVFSHHAPRPAANETAGWAAEPPRASQAPANPSTKRPRPAVNVGGDGMARVDV